MGITYEFDERERVLFTRAVGAICDEDLFSYANAVTADEKVSGPRRELIDCREAQMRDLTPEALRRAATLFAADTVTTESRVGIVTPADAAFGLARMYSAYRDDSGVELRVFRSMAEARAWLELDPAPDT